MTYYNRISLAHCVYISSLLALIIPKGTLHIVDTNKILLGSRKGFAFKQLDEHSDTYIFEAIRNVVHKTPYSCHVTWYTLYIMIAIQTSNWCFVFTYYQLCLTVVFLNIFYVWTHVLNSSLIRSTVVRQKWAI